MKVAVFGASGTIGAALVSRLAGEHEVTAVSRRNRPN
jgi:nucleoside-diphosphate-sugar epimerase